MTAEQVYQKFNNEYHLEGNHGGIQKHKYYVLNMMLEFARLMCDKQKEICVASADLEEYCEYVYGDLCTFQRVSSDSILNAPYPEELI